MQRTGSREAQRIAKLLARTGVGSRRDVERMIGEGRIAVNGTTVDTPATLLTSLHGVTVDGQPVQAPAPARLFLFHKPPGLLTAARDPKGRPTIHDRLPGDLPRVMPVGRLDLNTEGLLLLTTDGGLKRQLELPATGVERAYRARAYGQVNQAQLEELIDGVEIDGVRYGSIDANLERRTGANVWIELVLTEGKNREVRRVLEHLGLQVSRLIRTRYGPFVLGDLSPGAIGEVRQADLITARRALGTAAAAMIAVAPLAGQTQTRSAPHTRRSAPKITPSGSGRTDASPAGFTTQTALKPAPRAARASTKAPAAVASDALNIDSPRPARALKRKAGWAKPKPKSRPGRPRK